MSRFRRIVAFLMFVLPLALVFALSGAPPREVASRSLRKVPVYGNTSVLRHAYEKWKASIDVTQPVIRVPLVPSKVRSVRSTSARSVATVDLRAGTIAVETVGSAATDFDVWIVGRGSAQSSFLIGATRGEGTVRSFDVPRVAGFRLEKLVLTEPGRRPEDGAVLLGVPSLFDRLFAAERKMTQPPTVGVSVDPGQCAEAGNLQDLLDACVIAGEELFTGKDPAGYFNGNGRTCSTCHRPENNYTLDPDFIDTLPQSDPLFVAETNPDLDFDTNGGYWFEVPHLLRDKGLILVNADGGGLDRYVLRGVPHLLGVGRSLDSPLNPPVPGAPEHLLGWAGDGSPIGTFGTVEATGSLHDFALGAVRQHLTRTLGRNAGACDSPTADFCYPTDEQLTQIEAFLLSLGRRVANTTFNASYEEFDGNNLIVNNPYGCNRSCHVNAGGGENRQLANTELGTEDFLHCRQSVSSLQPFDGGRGAEEYTANPPGGCSFSVCNPANQNHLECLRDGSFGDQTFNSPHLFVAAETTPLFHNNMAGTLEELFGFYNSLEFMWNNDSIMETGAGTGAIDCDPPIIVPACRVTRPLIEENARYLRWLAAIDNIEAQIVPPLEKARVVVDDPETYDEELVAPLLMQAHVNMEDALDLLTEAVLYQETDGAADRIDAAGGKVKEFLDEWLEFGTGDPGDLEVAAELIEQARRIMTGFPLAADDGAHTDASAPVTFSVVANDFDYDGTIATATVDLDPATAEIQNTFSVPGKGDFSVNGAGQLTFVPAAGFLGEVSISYTVKDNQNKLSNVGAIDVLVG